MPRLIFILPPVVLVLIGVLFFSGLGIDPNTLPSPLLGKPLPAFRIARLDSPDEFLTHTELRGPALINFWASWCAACRDEHTLLLRLAHDEGVAIYGVDYLDQRASAEAWLAKLGSPYREILFDEQGALGAQFQLLGAPETYALDHNGIVRYRHAGALTQDVWERMRTAMAEPAASTIRR